MDLPPSEDLYLNRRAAHRIDFRSKIRFVEDPLHHLHLAEGVTQNLSLYGVQMLSAIIPESKKPFDIWIPVDGAMMLPATAKAAWISVEDSLGDSPYWVRSGVSLTLQRSEDREHLANFISKKLGGKNPKNEITDPKIGYVF